MGGPLQEFKLIIDQENFGALEAFFMKDRDKRGERIGPVGGFEVDLDETTDQYESEWSKGF